MSNVANVNPMAASVLATTDKVKVYDASREQDYTVPLSEVSDLLVADTTALANALQASFKDGLLSIGTLAIDATPEDFKTTTTAYYRLGSIQYAKAAATGISFSAADTINVGAASGSFWGVWLVQVNAAGAVSTKSPSADQVYASEAAAIAALPAVDAGNIAMGYITVNANDDVAWTANTDDLTPASDCADANFVDASVLTPFTAAAV